MRYRLLPCLVGAWLLQGCAPSVSVTVVAGGGAALDSLTIVGATHSQRLRDLAPGESLRVRLPVTGEDMLQLRGRQAGRALPREFGCYVEPGYRVRIEVRPDDSQTIRVRTPGIGD